ncbi:hypothetical protein DFR42_108107 [Undibacterium pigrum]|uniref:Uncharacterized protein n=1 Tax=Undibacterium pigrum TaxID=401470 RepID=A0A318IZB1_9BURK|nr:hypothetical protein DFR42_108107 [Undibacterium pigrum]
MFCILYGFYLFVYEFYLVKSRTLQILRVFVLLRLFFDLWQYIPLLDFAMDCPYLLVICAEISIGVDFKPDFKLS